MDINDISLTDIDQDAVTQYSKHCCSCPSRRGRHPVSSRELGRVRRFIRLLRKQHVLPAESPIAVCVEHTLLEEYACWLTQYRGLSSSTVRTLKRAIAKLLPLMDGDPEHYDVATVRQAIHTAAKQCTESHAKSLCNALRSYLRFLAASGRCLPTLAEAVPTVPHWRLSSMPRYICPEDLAKVVAVWEGSDHRSRRNRAIILLLARLGLRARDIVTLRIDDIHWEAATLLVKGKTGRQTQLPLPQDVGDALLAYLEGARGALAVPEIFLSLRAPQGLLTSTSAISGIVKLTLVRAGVENPPAWGAHLLRHSAATAMLREGATLQEVSMILRHRACEGSSLRPRPPHETICHELATRIPRFLFTAIPRFHAAVNTSRIGLMQCAHRVHLPVDIDVR